MVNLSMKPSMHASLCFFGCVLSQCVVSPLNRSTYFSFGCEFHEQREGAAMGFPVSAVIANLYMEFLRSWLLSQHPLDPGYMDDTYER